MGRKREKQKYNRKRERSPENERMCKKERNMNRNSECNEI